MTKVRRANLASCQTSNKPEPDVETKSSQEKCISKEDISSVEFSSDSEELENPSIPKLKALRQKVPKYKTLIDAFVEKYGIWKEASIVSETEAELVVHILYKNSTSNYKVGRKANGLPPFLAKYGTKTFIGKNYANITKGLFVDINYKSKWIVRKVIDIDLPHNRIKVQGKTFPNWIPLTTKHVLPLHHKTRASHPDHAFRIKFLNMNGTQPVIMRRKSARIAALPKRKRELTYREKLLKLGFDLKYMVGDGNCLFRAISHQVYGNSRHHGLIRSNCIDYLQANKERFTPFVISNEGGFEGYLEEKRKTGVWGDHIELQALCEIYSRSLYIFSESTHDNYVKLLKTMNEDSNYTNKPFLLSFLNEHYNSVTFLDQVEPEQIEQISLSDFFTISKLRKRLLDVVTIKKPNPGSLELQKRAQKKIRKVIQPSTRENPVESSARISDKEINDIRKAIELSKSSMMKQTNTTIHQSSNSKTATQNRN